MPSYKLKTMKPKKKRKAVALKPMKKRKLAKVKKKR